MGYTSLEAAFELAAGRDLRVITGHLLQLITTGSKKDKLSVFLRWKRAKEQRVKIKEGIIPLQTYFGVAGETGRKDKFDPPITTREGSSQNNYWLEHYFLYFFFFLIILVLKQILGDFQTPLNCPGWWWHANNQVSSCPRSPRMPQHLCN